MRVFLFALLFAALCGVALAWEKEDHEIFDIVADLEKAEGKGTDFYKYVGALPGATEREIRKAYRGLSMAMHPDKNPGDKVMADRYARLTVIKDILTDSEKRKRYDFFYRNGVPIWKGTGYFYSRWRPGFITVLVFLAVLTSLTQHLVANLNYKRDIQRINDLIDKAQTLAWAPRKPNGPVVKDAKTKIAVPIGGTGRIVECQVMREGEVFLLDPPNEPTLLSTDIVVRPAFSATWPFAVARSLQVKAGIRTPDEFPESVAEDPAVEAVGSDQDGVAGETSALSKTQLKRAARQEKMEKAAQAGAARRR